MYKYIFIAIIAAGFMYCGSIAERYGQGRIRCTVVVVFYVLAALVFCTFAGIRSISVGTDVEMYVVPSFELAQQADLITFFSQGAYAKWMPLSKLTFWLVSNIAHSVFWMLFVIQAVIVVPTLVALRFILKDKAWFGVLVFAIAFYPLSFNLMRQFMGMGFILLAYLFVRKRKPVLFVLFVGIAALFHETCLLGLLVYPVWLVSSGNLKRLTISPALLGLICLTLVQVFFPALEIIAPYMGKYGSYINGAIAQQYGGSGLTELRFIVLVCATLGILYMYFTRKKMAKPAVPEETIGLAAVVFFGVAVFSACLYSFQLFRLGLFFLYFAVLLIPVACNAISDKGHRVGFALAAVCFLALFGLSYYGGGSHEVVPYVIDLAGKF